MIKCIFSSKFLAYWLAVILEDDDSILYIKRGKDVIVIKTHNSYITLSTTFVKSCISTIQKNKIKQHNIRWDRIRDTLSKVPDQPVTLEITKKVVNVIFQY